MNISQLDQRLRNKQCDPLYVLLGTEAHLQQTAVAHIHKTIGEELQRLDAKETPVGRLLELAQGLGLFATRQLLLVSHCEVWKGEQLEALMPYVAAPNPATTIIFLAEKLDQRTKGAKALVKAAQVIECKPLYPNQLPAWIRMECQRHGKAIGQDGAQLLADAVGTDLGELSQAIEKLVLYVGKARLIEASAVEEVIFTTAQQSVFEFAGAVGRGDRLAAVTHLESLLSAGAAPLMLLAMLARHWRLLIRAQAALSGAKGRMHDRDLASLLQVHPFYVKEYAEQATKREAPKLAHGLEVMQQADWSLKRSRRPAAAVLTTCVMRLVLV